MRLLLILILLLPSVVFGGNPTIELKRDLLGTSLSKRTSFFKDPAGQTTIEEILNGGPHPFKRVDSKRRNFGFTSATIWTRFTIVNHTEQQEFLLETARPITNHVRLFVSRGDSLINSYHSGDGHPFSKRAYPHRKILFPIEIPPGEERTFHVRMDSDGEIVMFPLKIWNNEEFSHADRQHQLANGIYYGILIFVVLIFTFFFFVLMDRTFLYYVLYILAFALLQFSLDGYTYQYFFPSNGWMADRIVLFSSCLAVILVTLYARSYLKVPSRSKKLDPIFKGIMVFGGTAFLLTFFDGAIYEAMYPTINGTSFVGTLFILGSILYLWKKGYRISNWFFTAYLLLIVGVITFLIGNTGLVEPNVVTMNGLKLGSLGEVIFLSFSMAEKYRSLQEEKEKAQQDSLEKLQELNKVKDEYNKELEETVKARTHELEDERAKLDETNKEILSSIRYAQRIQNAILPTPNMISPLFEDEFVLFKPRDIVSGDFYWFASVRKTGPSALEKGVKAKELGEEFIPEDNQLSVFAAVDCTGHGVPGAFLSFVGYNTLNRALKEPDVNSPADALSFLDQAIENTFHNNQGEGELKDGMDIALCAIDRENLKLQFAGANNPCYLVREGELHEMKGDKKAIGGNSTEDGPTLFTDHSYDLQRGDTIYVFSDGFPDQFGGPKGKKFKYKPFKRLLASIQDRSMEEQHRILNEEFENWKGDQEQVDDVCVIGVRV